MRPPLPALASVFIAAAASALSLRLLPSPAQAAVKFEDACKDLLTAPPMAPAPGAPTVSIKEFISGERGFDTQTKETLSRIETVINKRYKPGLYDAQAINAVIADANNCLYNMGYPTSGAASVKVDKGTATYAMQVGKQKDMRIEAFDKNTGRREDAFVADWLQYRLLSESDTAFNVFELENRMRSVWRARALGRPTLDVRPGERRGEGVLQIETDRSRAVGLGVVVANDSPSSVGAVTVETTAAAPAFRPGFDTVSVSARRGEGVRSETFRYRGPLTATGPELSLSVGRAKSKYVEDVFSDLQIKSKSTEVEAALTFDLLDRYSTVGGASPAGEERLFYDGAAVKLIARNVSTATYLLGSPFSFDAASRDGRINSLELGAALTAIKETRGAEYSFATAAGVGFRRGGRGFSAGSGGDAGFSDYLLFEGYGSGALSLPQWKTELRLSFRGQWSADPVVPSSRFVVGGAEGVRGVDPGTLSGDSGHAETLEIIHNVVDWNDVQVNAVAFADSGGVTQSNGEYVRVDTMGGGFTVDLQNNLHARILKARRIGGNFSDSRAGADSAGLLFRFSAFYSF